MGASANLRGDGMDEAEFELWCNGEFAAGASGQRDNAWMEIMHYNAQYMQDGPTEIFEVKRIRVGGTTRPLPPEPKSETVDSDETERKARQ